MVVRVFKFRKWDEENSEMIDGDSLAFEEYAPLTDLLTQKGIMQYTGKKDKNDVEMYELDFVDTERGLSVIVYDILQCKYKACPVNLYLQNAGNGGWTGFDIKYHNEVLGNIYENKNLLEEMK